MPQGAAMKISPFMGLGNAPLPRLAVVSVSRQRGRAGVSGASCQNWPLFQPNFLIQNLHI